MNQFLGYAGNKVQSEKKLLRGVFKAGDVYFNTGDLLFHDHRGFLYFRDRVGDTFRYVTVVGKFVEIEDMQLKCFTGVTLN